MDDKDKELLNRVLNLILKEAKDARESAAYGGCTHDGGAALMETQVRFFQYGMSGLFPNEWMKYVEQAKKESDPEYTEYLRLQKKFK